MLTAVTPTVSDADRCRVHGWHPGTILVGREGERESAIVITAVGTEHMLAVELAERSVGGGWRAAGRSEHMWTLDCRDWQPMDPADRVHLPGWVAASESEQSAL